MRIGFFMKWEKGFSAQERGNVIGEEMYFEAMCRYLRELPEVESAELYAPNNLPQEKIDIMVHVNDTVPMDDVDRNVLYLQNGYPQGADLALEALTKNSYDGYILLSDKLLDAHRSKGFDGVTIPLGADTEFFHPRDEDASLSYDISYVGNDIKGKERTERFLMPATRFNLGLYGNWAIGNRGRNELFSMFGLSYYERYRVKLSRLARGKIPQEKLPVLYSSSCINLNITVKDAVDWDFWNLRPLEIMACGGLLMTDRLPSLEREFEGGAVFTDGGEDMISKIEEYLQDDAARECVSRKGKELVHESHSIKARASDVYDYLRGL